jgi:hypothetical protein
LKINCWPEFPPQQVYKKQQMSHKKIIEAAQLFAMIFVITTALLSMLNYRALTSFMAGYHVVLSGLATAFIWTGNGVMNDLLSDRFSWLKAPVRRFVVSLLATIVYTFLVWWLIASAWQAPERGIDLGRTLRNFELSDFLPTFYITLVISIFMHGRGFLFEWRDSVAAGERLQKEQVEARYETLKNQVNPHFLFNSLNVLTTLVHKDADLAEQFIRQLSAVYRYVLDSRDREVVTLEEELTQLEAFVFLMKIRFGDRFNTVIEVQDRSGKVAPLTLQMLLENALKHNEISKDSPLSVEIKQENDFIIVKNNLQTKIGATESSGVGLENIRSRYHFLSNRPVEVLQTADSFTVKIPIV